MRAARRFRVDHFAKVMRNWRSHADPDGGNPSGCRSFACGETSPRSRRTGIKNEWTLSQSFEGAWFGKARFDAETGALVDTAVDRRVKQLLGEQDDDGKRTPIAALRARAVADLIARGASIDDDGDPVANPRPSVVVTIPLKDLASQLGIGDVQGGTVGLSAGAVRRLACEAEIIPAVLGAGSEVLDLGRRYRVASHAQRAALALQYDTCAFGWVLRTTRPHPPSTPGDVSP